MTLCDLVTVFAETKSVTKSRLHCTYLTKKIFLAVYLRFTALGNYSSLFELDSKTFGDGMASAAAGEWNASWSAEQLVFPK